MATVAQVAPMNPSEIIAHQIIICTTDTITILASILFFKGFIQIKNKDHPLYMLLVLTIVDIAYALLSISAIAFGFSEDTVYIYAAMELAIYHFSLFWSAAIAFYIFKALGGNSFSPNRIIYVSTTICVILTALFPIM